MVEDRVNKVRDRAWDAYAAVPPPPAGPWVSVRGDPPFPLVAEEAPAQGARSPAAGHAFDADLDVAEVDEREHPCTAWFGRACRLSRSALVFRSRRMAYRGRCLLVAVHLIDSAPVGLFGKVAACEYDGAGLYVTELELLPLPDRPAVREWLEGRGRIG